MHGLGMGESKESFWSSKTVRLVWHSVITLDRVVEDPDQTLTNTRFCAATHNENSNSSIELHSLEGLF